MVHYFPGAQFKYGLDANKLLNPNAGDGYFAVDTLNTYVCYVAGTWRVINTSSLVNSGKADGNIYQNGEKYKLISINVYLQSVAPPGNYNNVALQFKSTSPPDNTFQVLIGYPNGAPIQMGYHSLVAIVPPQWYYQLVNTKAAGTYILLEWDEVTL